MSAPYFDDGTVTIWQADARHLPLPDGSVDLVVTSPPYYALRSYQDDGEHYAGQLGGEATPTEFVDALLDVTREMIRVLKPSGSIWVNLGDKYSASASGPAGASSLVSATQKERNALNGRRHLPLTIPHKSLMGIPWRYALRCIDELGLILRAEVIWSKPNGLPESVTDRVRRSHEQWFHFTRSPRYFSAIDEIREQCYVREPRPNERLGLPGGGMQGQRNIPGRSDYGQEGSKPRQWNPLGKLPGSVWTVPTQPLTVPDDLGIDHFAAFPMEFPRRIIAGWSPAGGTVLDPFGGTGTVALVAAALGRLVHHVDLSGDYCRLARWRVTDPGERARAACVPAPPVVSQEQGTLL